MNHFIAPLLLSISLSACSSWPIQGQGGLAEHYVNTSLPIEIDQDFLSVQALRLDSDHSARFLDILELKGANLCFPASVKMAKLRRNRIKRELVGGLYFDSANHLRVQNKVLHQLNERLSALSTDTCQSTQNKQLKTVSKNEPEKHLNNLNRLSVSNLLNSDNQFAFDSAKINPKYSQRLQKTCLILLDYPQITLNITGHSDATGTRAYNLLLSQKRALAVSQYLIHCGLKKQRIKMTYKGESALQYIGRAAEIDLVNRRVTVTISLNK